MARILDEYQKLAQRTSDAHHDRVLNGVMGLAGETGEIVDLVKKWRFQSGANATLPVEKLTEECGDVLWYCAELAEGLNLQLADLYHTSCAVYTSGDNSPLSIYDEAYKIMPIEYMALAMCAIAAQAGTPDEENIEDVQDAQAVLVTMMHTLDRFLKKFLKCDIETAMELNIEKLKRRYPDGFDPERSLHRNAAEKTAQHGPEGSETGDGEPGDGKPGDGDSIQAGENKRERM